MIVSVCLSHSAVFDNEIRSYFQAICLSILSVVCQDRLGTVRQILVEKNRADRQTVPDKIINKVRPRTESRPGATPTLRTNSRHNHRPPETHGHQKRNARSADSFIGDLCHILRADSFIGALLSPGTHAGPSPPQSPPHPARTKTKTKSKTIQKRWPFLSLVLS